MPIIMGDANAKVGVDNEGWEREMGRQGIGTMNENGERLAEFRALNNNNKNNNNFHLYP